MNKTLEAIKNEQVMDIREVFELVNLYELTYLNLGTSEHSFLSMQVNKYEEYGATYMFSQTGSISDNHYELEKNSICSYKAKWHEEGDMLHIVLELKNDMQMSMMILHATESFKTECSDGYIETDVYGLQEFLDDVICSKNEFCCWGAKLKNLFGMEIKMMLPSCAYVSDDLDDLILHISNDDISLKVILYDDSVNEFYKKESEDAVSYIIKPYGQPFSKIEMLFVRKNNDSNAE